MDDLEPAHLNEFEDIEESRSLMTDPRMIIAVIAVILGVAGIVIGAFGLRTSRLTTEKMAEMQNAIKNEDSQAVAQVALLRKELDSYETRLINVGSEVVKTKDQIRSVVDQVQKEFDKVSKAVNTNREEIAKSRGGTRPNAMASTQTANSATSPGATPPSSTQPSGPRIHIIKEGDIISKLARQYGVNVNAILEANPGVDPRRIQIDQKIVIPAP